MERFQTTGNNDIASKVLQNDHKSVMDAILFFPTPKNVGKYTTDGTKNRQTTTTTHYKTQKRRKHRRPLPPPRRNIGVIVDII